MSKWHYSHMHSLLQFASEEIGDFTFSPFQMEGTPSRESPVQAATDLRTV